MQSPGEHPQTDSVTPASTAEIQSALEVIVQSTPFRTTRQCQSLLRYIVDHTLAGENDLLRERVIGAEVFGRRPDYDSSEDPVVRIRAADVRRRLAQFYQDKHQPWAAVRIDVPSGSYRAAFDRIVPLEAASPPLLDEAGAELGPAQLAATPALALPAEAQPAKRGPALHAISGGRIKWSLTGAAMVVLFLVLGYQAHADRPDAFNQFWAPLLGTRRPVLICMGSNVAYQLSHEYMQRYLSDRHMEARGMETYVDLSPETPIPAKDVHPAVNSFVALGDVAAASRLVATLTRKGETYQERFPPDISFAEMQNGPAILVGGFNNQLTVALTKDLRFWLVGNSRVEDRQSPGKKWQVQFNGDAREAQDYAVISRLVDAKSGGPVLSIAGIGQYGTEAASEFVSDPLALQAFLKAAPKGWDKKSLQIVLHVEVIDFRPVRIEVVASSFR